MNDLIFFRPSAPISLEVVAARGGCSLTAGDDPMRMFDAVASLDLATPSDVSMFGGAEDLEAMAATRAGACFVTGEVSSFVPLTTIALVCDDPALSFERVAATLYPRGARPVPVFSSDGIAPTAVVHAKAHLELGVILDPGVVVGPGAEIGAGTTVGAGSTIGAGVRIGRGCAVDCNVSIAYAFLGDGVVVHAGARIGQGGPWLRADADANRLHLGRVIIQNGVEIGTNVSIERGGMGDTVIGEGSRIEALVSICADAIVGRLSIVTRR